MENKFTNSALVSVTDLTTHYNVRQHIIDTITPHMYVGQVSAGSGCAYFRTTVRQVSSNYVIGNDGKIGLSVEEKNRSWCSSNAENDHRAVTIECACQKEAPYALSVHALDSLIKLMADIAIRNNMGTLKWENDKSLIGKPELQNVTIHKWFSATNCPGDYILKMLDEIIIDANHIIEGHLKEPIEMAPYLVHLKEPFPVHEKPTAKSKIVMEAPQGVYTIVQHTRKWGKLKSGAGWIELLDKPAKITRLWSVY